MLSFSKAGYAEDDSLRQLIQTQRQRAAQFTDEVRRYAEPGLAEVQKTLPYGQNPTMTELSGTRTVVFVSRSMPDQSLLSLLKQGSGRKDVVFAFRGWGQGSIEQMFRYGDALIKKLPPAARQNPPGIIVHPASFAKYRIRYVPAVLHRDDNGKWYLVQGAMSVDSAVAAIKARRFSSRLSQQWPVSEPDQAEVLGKKATQHDWVATTRQARDGVMAVMGGSIDLPTAQTMRRYQHTPYVAAGYDIINPKTRQLLYPRGTRFNVLALDPAGRRAMMVINGADPWQVAFAQMMKKRRPQLVVLYTRLGSLAQSGLSATPLNEGMQKQLQVREVPTYFLQTGKSFLVFAVPPR